MKKINIYNYNLLPDYGYTSISAIIAVPKRL